jgi:hypothetical protein
MSAGAPDERLDVVRPFVMTGGRTRVDNPTLRIETLVQTDTAHAGGGASFEQARIVEMCVEPKSVAEIAVELGVPLGVAMVLVGDLVAADRLLVHHSDPIEIELDALTRMIERVRAL